MNHSLLRLFGMGISLILWGAPRATAQSGEPLAAVRPPAVTTATTVERIVTDALSSAKSSESDASVSSSLWMGSRVFNGLAEKHQDIDLIEVPLREALKRVLDDSKVPYQIDDDVPNEPKVSIKLTNAPLTTILDALTLSSKIGWRTEFKHSITAKGSTKDETGSGGFFVPVAVGDRVPFQIHVGKTVTALPAAFQFRTLDIAGPPPGTGTPQNLPRTIVAPQTPQLRIYRWQSQKRTFTCPHCHNSISILQQPEDVKCLKCHREFEENWKVCPFDGAKRPERKDTWRFCPICGKTIKMEASWSEPSHFIDYYRLDLLTSFETPEGTFGAVPSLLDVWNRDGEAYLRTLSADATLEMIPRQ